MSHGAASSSWDSNCQDNFPALLLQTEWPIKKGGLPVRINAYLQFYHFYALNLVNMAESGVKGGVEGLYTAK